MGDPRKIRRKYDKPSHPWQKTRIEEEKKVIDEYGLHNKKEIWRMETILRRFKNQVKSLASRFDKQSKLEEQQLVSSLNSLGFIKHDDPLDAMLGLELKDVMERRLQTLLVRKNLARSMKQARQFIIHGHVRVDSKKITFPSYIVSLKEESLIEFTPGSSLSKEDHPERMVQKTPKEKAEKKKVAVKEEAPPTFDQEEIEQLEEVGAVIKKEDKPKSEVKKEEKPRSEKTTKHKPEAKKEKK
ncbi:MAG TPA: 30S ribosomal protein S4 [Candidatus Nanoarchaeia archaeon]|nr:30S ribosomal protein S4 [Candidatus Nanoarchaeia archaeon]